MCTWPICAAPLTVGPTLLWTLCAKRSSFPFFSFSPLFFLLLDEAEGAIRGDQALQSSQLQFLSARASLYMGEYVQLIKIEK
jgi:hypothetical protein